MYVEDSLLAESKIVVNWIGRRKFELKNYKRPNYVWVEGRQRKVVKRIEEKRYNVQVFNESNYELNNYEIEVVAEIKDGYLIRRFERNKCVSEMEVLSVFPMVQHGFAKQFPYGNKHFPKVSSVFRNVEYSLVSQPDVDPKYKYFNFQNSFDEVPAYPGGINLFYKHLFSAIRVPSDITREDLEGVFLVSFTVDKSGLLKNVESLTNSQDLIAQSIVDAFPSLDISWLPARLDSSSIDFDYLLPLSFIFTDNEKVENDSLYTMPKYPGGEGELKRYVEQSIKYPVVAQEQGIEGKVFVELTIDKKGKVVKS